MANPLLVRALPEHLAERGQVIEIVENIAFFPRLAAIVEADLAALPVERIPPMWRESPVTIGLQFGWADARERLPELRGLLEARVDAVCQRCLDPCVLTLKQPVKLLLVDEETAGSSETDYEIWELDDDTVRPLDVVEELLIMALPMAATHASRDACGMLDAEVEPAAAGDTVRPFADLRARIEEQE